MKIFVIAANDYPHLWSRTMGEAQAYCQRKNAEDIRSGGGETRTRTYYHWHEVEEVKS